MVFEELVHFFQIVKFMRIKLFIVLFFSINLFIYLFLAGWVFVAARGLSLVAASGGYSSLRCGLLISMASLCCRARTLGARALVVAVCELSSCGSRAVERRLSSCGAWA